MYRFLKHTDRIFKRIFTCLMAFSFQHLSLLPNFTAAHRLSRVVTQVFYERAKCFRPTCLRDRSLLRLVHPSSMLRTKTEISKTQIKDHNILNLAKNCQHKESNIPFKSINQSMNLYSATTIMNQLRNVATINIYPRRISVVEFHKENY